MAARAQNGWPAGSDVPRTTPKIGDAEFVGGFRAGDVAIVLTHFWTEFDERVEKLVEGWCWGWAYRKVRAGISLSNHAAACAGDGNAPRHPLGKRGTFSTVQSAQIMKIIAEVNDAAGAIVLRWGGVYRVRADEMHVEIVGTPAQVARAAAAIKAAPVTRVRVSPTHRQLVADELAAWLLTKQHRKGTAAYLAAEKRMGSIHAELRAGNLTKGQWSALIAELDALHKTTPIRKVQWRIGRKRAADRARRVQTIVGAR